MSLTYFSICITEYSLSWTCYSLSITCHSLCERGPGPWVTRFAAVWGSLMDPLLIIHGSIYWIGPLDMWINHSRRTAHTTVLWKGFRAYLLPVTTDTLRLAGLRASPGHRSAASTVFLKSVFTGNFDGICSTSWAYGHIRSTLHMCVSMPGIDKIALVVQQLLLQVIPMDMAAKSTERYARCSVASLWQQSADIPRWVDDWKQFSLSFLSDASVRQNW